MPQTSDQATIVTVNNEVCASFLTEVDGNCSSLSRLAPRIVSIPPHGLPDKVSKKVKNTLAHVIVDAALSVSSVDTDESLLSTPATQTSDSSLGLSAVGLAIKTEDQTKQHTSRPTTKTSQTEDSTVLLDSVNVLPEYAVSGVERKDMVSHATQTTTHSKRSDVDRGSAKIHRSDSRNSIQPWPDVTETTTPGTAMTPRASNSDVHYDMQVSMQCQRDALLELRSVWWHQLLKKDLEIPGAGSWQKTVSEWINHVNTPTLWKLNTGLANIICCHGGLCGEPVFTKGYTIVDHINMVLDLRWEEFRKLRYLPTQFSTTVKACMSTACRSCMLLSSQKFLCICGKGCVVIDTKDLEEDKLVPANLCVTGLSILLWGLCLCDYPTEFSEEPDMPFIPKPWALRDLVHVDRIKEKFFKFYNTQKSIQRNLQKRFSRFSEPAGDEPTTAASGPKQMPSLEGYTSSLNIAQKLEMMVKIMQFLKLSEYHLTPIVTHMILRSNMIHCVAAIIETIEPESRTVNLLQIAALDWVMALYRDERLRDIVLLQYVNLRDEHRIKYSHENMPPTLDAEMMHHYIPYLRKSIAGRIISKARPVPVYRGKPLSRAGEQLKAQALPPARQYHIDVGLLAKNILEEFGDNLQHDLGLIGLRRVLYTQKVGRSESWSSWIFQGNNQVAKVADTDFIQGFCFPEDYKREFEATKEATERLLKDITQTWPRHFIVRYNEKKPDLIRVLVAGRKCSDHEGGLFEFHFMVPRCYPLYPLRAMLGIPNGVIERPFGADVCGEISMRTYAQTGSVRDDIIKMAETVFKPVEEIPDITTGDTNAILNSVALRYQENSALYKTVVHSMSRWFDAPETDGLGGFRIAKTSPIWGETVNMWFLLNSRFLAQKTAMIHTRLLRPSKEDNSSVKPPKSLTPKRKGIIDTRITMSASQRLSNLATVWDAYLKNTQTHITTGNKMARPVGDALFEGEAED
ncbi:uncharacterized protein BROUX77_005822 [Berkeleyomyces rouxiae]|uniref:uncharacterized protein n=1 Tax=Berkeleyomyces rouxiae TaxID=2035830 RepID=UPI003B784913